MTGTLPKRLFRSAALAAGLCAVISGPALAQELVLKAGHAASTSNTGHKAFEFLAQELADNTDGRISLEIYPSSQLGSERELVESIQLGNVDMTFVSSAVLGNFNPQFFALDIPFMFKDRDDVYRVLDGEIGQNLLTSLEQVGIKGLGYWENGFRQLTNSKRDIRSPEDLEGMRMRTMENAVHLEAWRNVGANPAPLAFGELFTALQQGTFDAQEGPINLFYDMRFNEVQKHITKTNHIYSPWPVLINPDIYNSLSDEDRVILEEAVAKSITYQRNLAQQADEAAVAAMSDVTITELSPEELEAFASHMDPIYDMVRDRVGDEIIDDILAEIN